MISAARSIGIPARYVNGYMHNNSIAQNNQHMLWAEFYIDNLGGLDLIQQIIVAQMRDTLEFHVD